MISIICAIICAFVLIGGIQRLADVCSLLVPVMAVIYVVAALVVILVNITEVPAAITAIVVGAFNPSSVAGGLAGVGIKTALTKGVGRGIFSNEAGLGSAPIAHAAADVDHPVKQGIFGVFEVFMDTIVVCTMTALVVLLGVGVQNIEYGNDIGAALTIQGFQSVFGGAVPGVAVAICLTLFALSTVLTWALYGSRCVEYLFGFKASNVY
jgi:AGCS family alanine or glycine:cation symporter